MKIIWIVFVCYLIYDYIRDRKIEKEFADIKTECMKRSDTE